MFNKISSLYLSMVMILTFSVAYSQCDMPSNSLSINGSDASLIDKFKYS